MYSCVMNAIIRHDVSDSRNMKNTLYKLLCASCSTWLVQTVPVNLQRLSLKHMQISD